MAAGWPPPPLPLFEGLLLVVLSFGLIYMRRKYAHAHIHTHVYARFGTHDHTGVCKLCTTKCKAIGNSSTGTMIFSPNVAHLQC